MIPADKIRDIWPWLPAFKVVAEAQHLPTAAARLHVSASALSRTVRLIEDALGEELFVRTSRRIVLNSVGKRLLELVQRTVGALEGGVRELLLSDFSGEYRVSSLGVLSDFFVLPALLGLPARHPACVPYLTTLRASEANRHLGGALLDLAFYYDATTMDGITCRKIGSISNSIYCGREHALFGRARAPLADVLAHSFSVPAVGDRGSSMDNWPIDVPRTVGFKITMLSSNLAVSLASRYLTVLPDVVARPHVREGALFRLPHELVPATDVYAACRDEDLGHRLNQEVISAVEETLASARAEMSKGAPNGTSKRPKTSRVARRKTKRKITG